MVCLKNQGLWIKCFKYENNRACKSSKTICDLKFTSSHQGFLKIFLSSFFKKNKMEFTLCKAEQPLQGMELQEKEAQKDRKSVCKEPAVKRCQLILDLKPLKS